MYIVIYVSRFVYVIHTCTGLYPCTVYYVSVCLQIESFFHAQTVVVVSIHSAKEHTLIGRMQWNVPHVYV